MRPIALRGSTKKKGVGFRLPRACALGYSTVRPAGAEVCDISNKDYSVGRSSAWRSRASCCMNA